MKTILKTIVILSLSLLLFNCGSDDDSPSDSNKTPTVTTISPTSGPKTTIVTINGQDFGTDINNVTVFFNDVEGTVQAVTDTQVTAEVPARAYTGKVKVVVSGKETEGPIFTYTIIDIQVSTFAGSTEGDADGSGTSAQFSTLGQIAMDSNGNIFVADAGNNKIKKITPSGVVSAFAGSTQGDVDGIGSAAQLNYPYGIAIDSNNNVFIADSNNDKIKKITPSGAVTTFAGSGSSGFADGQGTAAQFNFPVGLAIDSQDNLYVTDYQNNRIRKITPSGVVSTFAGNGTDGSQDGQGVNAEFTSPLGIAVDSQNNVYIGDEGIYNIRKITPNGDVTTLAGSGVFGDANGQGTNAQFTYPSGLSVDKQGTIYVADYSNNRIRKITPNGLVSTFVGSSSGFINGSGANAKFNTPYSVIIDDNYDVYITDRGNYKIRKITQE